MPRVLTSAALLAAVGLAKKYTDEELNQGCPDSPQCCTPSTCWGWLGAVSSLQCSAWRGETTCEGASVQSGWCRCTGKAICNEDGHCESQDGDVEPPSKENCPSEYVGTCITSGCNADRGPTECHLGKCVCPANFCSIDGKCISKDAEDKPTETELKDEQAELEADLKEVEAEEKGGQRLYEQVHLKIPNDKVGQLPTAAVAAAAMLAVGGAALVVQRSRRTTQTYDAEQPEE